MLDKKKVCDKCGQLTGRWTCDFCKVNEAFGAVTILFHYGSRFDSTEMPERYHICDECYGRKLKDYLGIMKIGE